MTEKNHKQRSALFTQFLQSRNLSKLKNVNKEMKSCYFKRYFPILALFLLVTIILLNLPKSTKKSVPNVVHFVLLKEANETDIDFIGATCILAAFLNQEPEKIVLHTNVQNVPTSFKWGAENDTF